MYGIIIVGHRNLPEVLFEIITDMTGDNENFDYLNVYPDDEPEKVKDLLTKKVNKMKNKYEKVLILTDMFGGTPSNLALTFLEKDKIEVITGVNLPMILKLKLNEKDMNINEITKFIKEYGKRNICIASELLGC